MHVITFEFKVIGPGALGPTMTVRRANLNMNKCKGFYVYLKGLYVYLTKIKFLTH